MQGGSDLVGHEPRRIVKRRLCAPGSIAAAASLIAMLTLLFAPLAARGAEVPANGRAWELVTPSDPVSVRVSGVIPMEGEDTRLIYLTDGPLPGAASGLPVENSNLATRGQSGWGSTPVGFPYSVFSSELSLQLAPVRPVRFSDDRLTSLWLSGVPLTPDSPPEGQSALYRLAPDGTLTMIAPVGKLPPLSFAGLTYMSGDGDRVLFSSGAHLLPADATRSQGESIYEWDGADLRLVDVDNGGSLLSACGSTVSGPHGVSTTGNRVFFVDPANPGCTGTARVYVREAGGSTVEVSASQCARIDCNPPQGVAFAGATPSGDSVFLTTAQQLTDDDVDESRDLYRYDIDSHVLTLLTVAQPEATGEVSDGSVYPSEDGARIYFKAIGRLVTGEGPVAGENLYLADGSGLHFVAPSSGRVELARDGRSALFVAKAGLVEEDSDGREDVYLYDADDSAYTRLSVGSVGGDGPFDAKINAPLEEKGSLGGEPRENYRSITEDGKDAFFSTSEELVPEDVNEAVDVYEWKEGNVGLVSSGTAVGLASFGGVSDNGRTALFKTTATLTASDRDGGDGDLYAARIGGGFPLSEEKASCQGTACEGTTRAPLERSLPRSATSRTGRSVGRIRLRSVRWGEGREPGAGDRPISVKASVPAAGRVSARVWTRGAGGKRVTLAFGSEGVIRPGKVRILLRLTTRGLRSLAQHNELSGQLSLREDDLQLLRPLRLAPEETK